VADCDPLAVGARSARLDDGAGRRGAHRLIDGTGIVDALRIL
jgi:hypothetical protein